MIDSGGMTGSMGARVGGSRAEFNKVPYLDYEGKQEAILKTAPYKTWVSDRCFKTDLLHRGRRRRGTGSPVVKPIEPPRIVYEQEIIQEFLRLKRAPSDLSDDQLQQIHYRALREVELWAKEIPEGSYAMGYRQYEEDLDRIRSGLEWERVMRVMKTMSRSNITYPKEGNVGIIENKVAEQKRPRQPPPAEYRSKYVSVDGNEYVFRSHFKTRNGPQLDTLNTLLHCMSELVKGGEPLAPLAAAQIKLVDSTGATVIDFKELYGTLADEAEQDEIQPEVEIDEAALQNS